MRKGLAVLLGIATWVLALSSSGCVRSGRAYPPPSPPVRAASGSPSPSIPTHSPVAPRPRNAAPFRGLGTWVDVYDHGSWADPAAAVAGMKARGVQTLYLQTSNYSRPYDVRNPKATGEFIDQAHEQGIRIVAWYLPGLADLGKDLRRSEAAIAFRSSTGQAFDGFGLDIEAQILDPPWVRSEALLSLSGQIRSAAPDLPMAAITPSPVFLQTPPNGWRNFPWAGLNLCYDAFVPMDYFTSLAHGRQEVKSYVELSAQIIRGATGDAAVPIAPIGGIAQAISAPEARGFVDAIRAQHLAGGSLYDFRTTTDPAVWAALGQIGP